jgi:hypothetical protein
MDLLQYHQKPGRENLRFCAKSYKILNPQFMSQTNSVLKMLNDTRFSPEFGS